MKRPMEGVRIVEVAQFTFVPASGGVLAEWGADVIKVEHAVTGDAQRGLVATFGLGLVDSTTSFAPMMEGPNRGKRSVGIALEGWNALRRRAADALPVPRLHPPAGADHRR
jgi:crotonobetainyl-CoA:carnitine CoA-transferase CaiB-like acyl-CoA transferase